MPANTLKPSAAKTTLRQLSVLGLPRPMLRDTLATLIQRLIHCDLVNFNHLDAAGSLSDAWINLTGHAGFDVYLTEFYNAREAETYVTCAEFLRSKESVDLPHLGHGNFVRSDLYQRIHRPNDFRYIARAALRNGPVAQGHMSLTRRHGDKDFNPTTLRLIEAIAPFVTHALTAPKTSWVDVDTVEVAEGQLICNGSGDVEYASSQGRALLHGAADVPVIGATLSDPCCVWARPLLKRLVDEVRMLEGGHASNLPHIEQRVGGGEYVLRAWSLAATSPTGTPSLYTVSIRRYIPMALRLLQSPALQNLSAREQQVGLLLADGLETKEIARRMGITPHTAIHYVRTIYQRLEINGRAELLPRLMRT